MSARVKESSGENNQEQKKSGDGSSHENRIFGESNTEQNSIKVDIDPIRLETAQDNVICVERDLTESKMMVYTKAIVEQNASIFNKKSKAEARAPNNELAEGKEYYCDCNEKNKEKRAC